MTAPRSPVGAWDSSYHAPVLVEEVVQLLAPPAPPGGVATPRRLLDCTLGGGGHSAALLEAGAEVYAVDRDPEAVAAARDRLREAEVAGMFHPVVANYADIDRVSLCESLRFDGILLDLGISSHQLDHAGRGFTFREGAPLDMRMGADAALDAAALLNESDERELMRVFKEYADEHRASRLARVIARRRENRPFATSDDLVGAIREALGPRSGPPDFARIFQGVRIAVNDELTGLERALPALRDRLVPGGTLAVIAYHSGEDRAVKRAMREWSADCVCPPRQIVCTCRGRALGALVTRKAVTPGAQEMARNPRSRSAKLRAWRSAA
jgi:16S rRNA (cytosine1402-N4)-methyltransferase